MNIVENLLKVLKKNKDELVLDAIHFDEEKKICSLEYYDEEGATLTTYLNIDENIIPSPPILVYNNNIKFLIKEIDHKKLVDKIIEFLEEHIDDECSNNARIFFRIINNKYSGAMIYETPDEFEKYQLEIIE